MLDGLFFGRCQSAKQPRRMFLSGFVLLFFFFFLSLLLSLPSYLSCTVALMPAQKFFFYPSDGGLCLGKCPAKMLS